MTKKVQLFSSIPLLMYQMPHLSSFVLGIWIRHGSRHEPPSKNGLSHFIEHLFFQGTQKRDASAISYEIDNLGGELNAFTSREFTVLYVKVLSKYMIEAIELLGDIFSNPLFNEVEIEKERAVILDEIRTVRDTPDELIHDIFMEQAFLNGLGQPILGKEDTVSRIEKPDILECFKAYYATTNSIISCTGNFDERSLIGCLEKNLVFRSSNQTLSINPPKFSSSINVFEKNLSEVHLSLGIDTFPFKSSYRFPLLLLNCIIGGSVSSKLFQEIREKRGLVYNIYSYVSFYSDTGLFEIYTACDAKKVNEILSIIKDVLRTLPDTITAEELERAKRQTSSQILFSLESPSAIMHNLAYQELYTGETFDSNEYLKNIEKVGLDDLKSVANFLRDKSPAITLLGSIKREEIDF